MLQMNEQKKRWEWLLNLFRGSLILTWLSTAADWVYQKAATSLAGGFFTAYDDMNNRAQGCLLARIFRALTTTSRFARSFRLAIMRSFEGSRLLNGLNAWMRSLLGQSLRLYGVFFLSFGIYSSLIFLIQSYLTDERNYYALYTSGVCALIALLLMSGRAALIQLMLESRIMSFLLFSVIGLRREELEDVPTAQGRSTVAFISGMIFGLMSWFLPPYYLLAALILLTGAAVIMKIPECGVIAILFLAPFMGYLPRPTILTAMLLMYVAFCFFLKLIRGKRVLHFDLLDGSILLFSLFLLMGGLFSVERSASMQYGVLYFSYLLGYFLVVNLLRTRAWVNRCIAALLISSGIVSLYGIYQNFFGMTSKTWQDKEMFTEISGRVISTFENPNVLAEYLIMSIPFAIAVFLVSHRLHERFGALLALMAGGGCLIYTWSRGAWLGFMIAMVMFFLIYTRKTMVVMLLGVFSLPLLPFVLPSSIIQRFASIGDMADSSTAYRVHIWQGAMAMIQDCWLSGIGVGQEVFGMVYPSYTLAGIESAPHSHNLYLQLTIELGVFGLAAFVAAMVLFVQSILTFCARPEKSMVQDKILCAAGMCGALAILAQGMTDYVWYNYRVFLIFWILIGLTSAIRRCSVETLGERPTDYLEEEAHSEPEANQTTP